MELFNALGGPGWAQSESWLVGDPCADAWFGVYCDSQNRVVKLFLSNNKLIGAVPESIVSLTALTEIHLRGNRLTGTLPSLRSVGGLKVLDVTANQLSGLPEDISDNVALEVLAAGWNALTRMIRNWGNLVNLKILELNDNEINDYINFSNLCLVRNIWIFNVANSTLNGQIDPECLRQINPYVFDISNRHPLVNSTVEASLTGAFEKSIINNWTNIDRGGYLSVYFQFGITGHVPSVCLDLRTCRSYNFRGHGDMSWTDGNSIPPEIMETIALAKSSR